MKSERPKLTPQQFLDKVKSNGSAQTTGAGIKVISNYLKGLNDKTKPSNGSK